MCGKPVYRRPSEMQKSRHKEVFCSGACWYQHNQREQHYLWGGGQHARLNPNGRAWRAAVIKRDRNRCRICLEAGKLEVHHIHPFRSHPEKRWDVNNGVALCRRCHKMIGRREMEYAATLTGVAQIPLHFWDELHLLRPAFPLDLSDGANLGRS
jgi:5-methylcytosine-specific restriction endonuclease McrA